MAGIADNADGRTGRVTTNMTVTKEIDYLGTVRGRLGWLVNPTLLVYGTGGLAYGGPTFKPAYQPAQL
jgi:outer membrane immunogenic protein